MTTTGALGLMKSHRIDLDSSDDEELDERHSNEIEPQPPRFLLFGFISVPLPSPRKSIADTGQASQSLLSASKETAKLRALLLNLAPNLIKELASTGEVVDEPFLQRWIIARHDVDKAAECILTHHKWRVSFLGAATNGQSRISEDCISSELAAEKTYLQSTVTSQGCPVVVFKTSKHDMGKRDLTETKRLICYILDNALAAADPTHPHNPLQKMVCLFDLTGAKPKNLDAKALLAIFELLQDQYPERLQKLYFINAPWIFWGIWNVVSPFVHPNTRTKIAFVSGESGKEQLRKEVGRDALPLEFGGDAEPVLIQDAVADMRKHGGNRDGGVKRRRLGFGRSGNNSGDNKAVVANTKNKNSQAQRSIGGLPASSRVLLERMMMTQLLLFGFLLRVFKRAWQKTKGTLKSTVHFLEHPHFPHYHHSGDANNNNKGRKLMSHSISSGSLASLPADSNKGGQFLAHR